MEIPKPLTRQAGCPRSRRCPDGGTALAQRQRRWANAVPPSGRRLARVLGEDGKRRQTQQVCLLTLSVPQSQLIHAELLYT